jgi:hypothetical protein
MSRLNRLNLPAWLLRVLPLAAALLVGGWYAARAPQAPETGRLRTDCVPPHGRRPEHGFPLYTTSGVDSCPPEMSNLTPTAQIA